MGRREVRGHGVVSHHITGPGERFSDIKGLGAREGGT